MDCRLCLDTRFEVAGCLCGELRLPALASLRTSLLCD